MTSHQDAERFGQAVAAQVRAEIAAAGTTVAGLARLTGINRETLDRWVKGERALNVPTLYRIAIGLGLDPHLVVERAEERFTATQSLDRGNVSPFRQTPDLYTVEIEEQAAASTDDSAGDPQREEP